MMSSSSSSSSSNSDASSTMICIEQAFVDRHFAGTISERDERSMRAHITDCNGCRARYRRHLLLATLDPTAPTAEERIGRALGLLHERPRAKLLPIAGLIVAAAIAALLLVVLRPPPSSVDEEKNQFAARGSIPSSSGVAPSSTSSSLSSSESKISIYRISNNASDAKPAMLLASDVPLGARDELAFSYQNADANKTHLMIFGVDERGRVYWFHPAWSSESENPSAVRIETDTHPHELREAIRHQFAGEKLEIHGLFLDHPLTVRDVEAAVRARKNETGALTVAGGSDHITMFGMLR